MKKDLNWTTGNSNSLGRTIARFGFSSGNGSNFNELNTSENQAAMLGLIGTSNVGVVGLYFLEVRNGQVSPPTDVTEPTTFAILCLDLLDLVGLFIACHCMFMNSSTYL
jgi:hypothetical protein